MIPTEKECLELHNNYNMLYNIRKHSFKVRDLSIYLAKKLNKNGYNLNLNLLNASALLHDITKTHQIVMLALKKRNKEWFFKHKHLVPNNYKQIVIQWKKLNSDLNLNNKYNHVFSGERLLTNLGYEEVGKIIAKHDKPLTEISESSIMCYADRRIINSSIVSLEKRFNYLEKVYGKVLVNFLKTSTFELEKKILKNLNFKSGDLLKI